MEKLKDRYAQTAHRMELLLNYIHAGETATAAEDKPHNLDKLLDARRIKKLVAHVTQSDIKSLEYAQWYLEKIGNGAQVLDHKISPSRLIDQQFRKSPGLKRHESTINIRSIVRKLIP